MNVECWLNLGLDRAVFEASNLQTIEAAGSRIIGVTEGGDDDHLLGTASSRKEGTVITTILRLYDPSKDCPGTEGIYNNQKGNWMAKGDGVPLRSARWMALKAVIESAGGRAAMLEAIKAGNPPLCGVDALLTAIITDYRAKDDQVLRSAGSLVAEVMRAMG